MNRTEGLRATSRAVRVSALCDLAVTLPFATPWTAGFLIDHLRQLHVQLGLSGAVPPGFDPMHLFFVNLFGTLAMLWAVLRAWSPELRFGVLDMAARIVCSVWMVHALWLGQTSILVPMLVLELAWFFVQGGAILRWRSHHEHARLAEAT